MPTLEEIKEQIKAIPNADTFGTKKEIKELPKIFDEQEKVLNLTSGMMDNNTWLIVLTPKRVIFLDKGMIYGLKQVDIPLDKINSIEHKTGMIFGEILHDMKNIAQQIIDNGPSKWDQAAIDRARYGITDLVDDIRFPRNYAELIGTGAKLYEVVSDFYLRANNNWSAKGKTINRKLNSVDKGFAHDFEEAFSTLFKDQDPSLVISLCKKTLEPFGGFLFDGYKLDAPKDWRCKK